MAKRSSAEEAARRTTQRHSFAGPDFAYYDDTQMRAMFLAGVRWARRQAAKKRRAGK